MLKGSDLRCQPCMTFERSILRMHSKFVSFPFLLNPRSDAPKQTKATSAAEQLWPDGRSSVTVSCNTDSYPQVTHYTWYRKTEDNKRATAVSNQQSYTVHSDEPGIYYCTAKNEINEASSEPIKLFLDSEWIQSCMCAVYSLYQACFVQFSLNLCQLVLSLPTHWYCLFKPQRTSWSTWCVASFSLPCLFFLHFVSSTGKVCKTKVFQTRIKKSSQMIWCNHLSFYIFRNKRTNSTGRTMNVQYCTGFLVTTHCCSHFCFFKEQIKCKTGIFVLCVNQFRVVETVPGRWWTSPPSQGPPGVEMTSCQTNGATQGLNDASFSQTARKAAAPHATRPQDKAQSVA